MFAAPRTLFEAAREDFPNPGDEVVSLPGNGRPARVVRVTATLLQDRGQVSSFELAELQAWSGGTNLAFGRPVRASDVFADLRFPRWRPDYLVDGYNGRHRTIDLPAWLDGLNRRREVADELAEAERAREAAGRAVAGRAAWAAVWLAGLVGLAAVWLVWRARRARLREVEGLRARIAADLHDEVGSQLAGIGLAAELAAGETAAPAGVRERLDEIGQMARDATDAMRDIVWLLKSGPVTFPELVARLRETAAAALRGTDHRFEAPDGFNPRPVSVEFARQVGLVFKEALANAVRHAGAKGVRVAVRVADGRFVVALADGGAGFDPAAPTDGNGLANMALRAARLGGTLTVDAAPGRGTRAEFTAPVR